MRRVLEQGGIVNLQPETAWLIEVASGMSRNEQLSSRRRVDAETERRALHLAARRASGEPLQYVTGTAAFRHLELSVGPGVFIPRPETELVAERAMELLPQGGALVDVGTGSGAIALAVAYERADARVLATESSGEALAYAQRNADRLKLSVELFSGDLLDALPATWKGSLDVCVSNPPYVPVGDRIGLPGDVVDHEPHVALFSEDDGLGTIRKLAAAARDWVRPGGRLVLEVGDRQGAAVRGILEERGYQDIAIGRDMTGRQRIAEARV